MTTAMLRPTKSSLDTTDRIRDLIGKAVERYEYIYSLYPNVNVFSSGGKDSAALAECAAIAHKWGAIRKPTVRFMDEELVSQYTVEYMLRQRDRDDMDVEWYCVPIKSPNAWGGESPYWYPWAPERTWSREMPEWALRSYPGYVSPEVLSNRLAIAQLSMADCNHYGYGNAVIVVGIRIEESPARRMSLGSQGWISKGRPTKAARAAPISEWLAKDIWGATADLGWDTNRSYLHQWQSGVPLSKLRVGPPLGDGISAVKLIPVWEPGFWERVLSVVPDAGAAARYADTALLGAGQMSSIATADNDDIWEALDDLDRGRRKTTINALKGMKRMMVRHNLIPTTNEMYKVAIKGDSGAQRKTHATVARRTSKEVQEGKIIRVGAKPIISARKGLAKSKKKSD